MHVRVLFFGLLKDIVGSAEEQLEVAQGARIATVFEHYAARFPRIRDMAASVVLARNQEFAEGSVPVAEGDEIALLPPVSGGATPAAETETSRYSHQILDPAGHFFALTRHPIDTREVIVRLLQGQDGAVVTFEGVVRNNTKGRATRFLDYECYEPMAIRTMAEIGRALAGASPIDRIAMVHRLGRMEIGETSVAVMVTAPHRKPAFEAALEGINRLKRLVPIWKKEYFADGETWVEGEWDRDVPNAAHP